MKPLTRATIALSLGTALASTMWALAVTSHRPTPSPPTIDTGPTIERITALASLTTLGVEVADVVVSEFHGHVGSAKAVLIVKGDVTLGVDLSAATFEGIDRDARTAVLRLPQPKLQTARVDHERTKLLGVQNAGLWTVAPGGGDADAALVNAAFRDAQRIVAGTANDPAIAARARRQTELVIRQFFAAMGWDVTVAW